MLRHQRVHREDAALLDVVGHDDVDVAALANDRHRRPGRPLSRNLDRRRYLRLLDALRFAAKTAAAAPLDAELARLDAALGEIFGKRGTRVRELVADLLERPEGVAAPIRDAARERPHAQDGEGQIKNEEPVRRRDPAEVEPIFRALVEADAGRLRGVSIWF